MDNDVMSILNILDKFHYLLIVEFTIFFFINIIMKFEVEFLDNNFTWIVSLVILKDLINNYRKLNVLIFKNWK